MGCCTTDDKEESENNKKKQVKKNNEEEGGKKEREKKEKDKKEKNGKEEVRPFGGGRPNKMANSDFAKQLADKLKNPPPGTVIKGGVAIKSVSKPPVIESNVDMVNLLEKAPFEDKVKKKKPSRKVFN